MESTHTIVYTSAGMIKKLRKKLNELTPKLESSPGSDLLLIITSPFKSLRKSIKKLYSWTVKWAAHPKANWALGGISFSESSFFPLPPDPLLLTMTFAKPKFWWRFALLTTIGSVLGGMFGYFIGFAFFESIGEWLVNVLHLQSGFESVAELYAKQSFWAVFAAAFTPIPYKIFTIAAGVFRINFPGFVIASLFGRGLRFFAVAGAAHLLGKKYKDQIERYVDVISLGLLAVIIIGLFASRLF